MGTFLDSGLESRDQVRMTAMFGIGRFAVHLSDYSAHGDWFVEGMAADDWVVG